MSKFTRREINALCDAKTYGAQGSIWTPRTMVKLAERGLVEKVGVVAGCDAYALTTAGQSALSEMEEFK